MAAKAAVHGAPQKAFSRNASDENERWKWTEEVYQRKNDDVEKNNNYDWNRRELNFEINHGKIEKLGSNKLRLHERLQQKLDELKFKTYKDDAQNKPNCCVDWVFSGDHDRMCEMAFGKSYRNIDYSLKSDNTEAIKQTDAYKYLHPEGKKKQRQPEIYKWATEVYKFACRKWGEENIIGMEVHLDETTPHAHVLMVPVAERKSRGRVSTKYQRKDAPSVTIKKQEYELLPEDEKNIYQPVSKKSQRLVSYSGVFGDNYPERKEYMKQFHTDFYEQVGKHFELERGDDLDLLDPEERRKRRHMRKDQLHAVQEHERKVIELSSSIASLQDQNDKLKAEHAKLKNRMKALPSSEELDVLETKSKTLKDEIASREERLNDLPSLESIIERENRHKTVPSLDDIIKREKKFKADKQQLVRLLSVVREELEEQKDYSLLGDLNKLGNIKDEVEWFNATSIFLSLRNQKLLEEEEKLRQKVKTANNKVLILTDSIESLEKEKSRLNRKKRSMYQSSVLPVVDDGIKVTIEKSQDGDICVFARVGEKWLGKELAGNVLDDYKYGIATKEQIAALYLSGDILQYASEKKAVELDNIKKELAVKKAELANIHFPTKAEIEAARRCIACARKEEYEKLVLPKIRSKIETDIAHAKGDTVNIYVWAKVDEGKWHNHKLTDGQYKDYRDGIATKEQLAALLLSDEIINDATEQAHKRLMNFEEKPWTSELMKRTVSLSGELGATIKQTINDLDDMTRELHPNPTPERLGRINFMLSFLVQSEQAKDRREAANKLCDIAIPLSKRCDGLWREHVVDIVKAVAEQGPQIDLHRGRGRGIR